MSRREFNNQRIERSSTIRSDEYLSEIELKILRSLYPIEVDETNEITYNNQKAIWLNKNEVQNWKGPLDIENYVLNQDNNPLIINKNSENLVQYIQELSVRYLKPPTPPTPPPIIIKQNPNILTPAAPPLIIRQISDQKPKTPEPLVIREYPPRPPSKVEQKVIVVPGKKGPPPPRKVIIERLPPIPPRPPKIIIERWLPYKLNKRKVIFQRAKNSSYVVKEPRNVIIDWEHPDVEVEKHYSFLGVVKADPNKYRKKYGDKLKKLEDFPELMNYLKKTDNIFENESNLPRYELEGDVEALKLIDLEKEGLGQYRDYLQNYKKNEKINTTKDLNTNYFLKNLLRSDLSSLKTSNSVEFFIDQVFESLNNYNNGKISYNDARNIFVKYSAKHGNKFDDEDFKELLKKSNLNDKNSFDLNDLKILFLKVN